MKRNITTAPTILLLSTLLLCMTVCKNAKSSSVESLIHRDLQTVTPTFNSFITNDCVACLQRSNVTRYCYNTRINQEWCCNHTDFSANCSTNTDNGILCSPNRVWGSDLAYSYCKGAGGATGCGVDS